MVEVFKTNVYDRDHAETLLDAIHETFHDYRANFDLEDCDKILRVKSGAGKVQPYHIINMMSRFGYTAEVLPDDDDDHRADTIGSTRRIELVMTKE